MYCMENKYWADSEGSPSTIGSTPDNVTSWEARVVMKRAVESTPSALLFLSKDAARARR
jgi:hypothetical protein